MQKPLKNKVALITGANQGLGLAIAKAYLQAGASLMICAREPTLLAAAREQLASIAGDGQRVLATRADVSSPEDVTALVNATLEQLNGLDVLVNNAGVYGPKGSIDEVDWSEWCRALEINLMGSVLMSRAVLPHFKSKRRGKIVQLSGGGATNPLPMLSAYAVSKAAVIRFIETLAEEVREFKVDVNAIAPGALNTRMLDEILRAGPAKVGRAFFERSVKQKQNGGVPLDRGADLAVFLGSPASDGITGKLVSALWDNWQEWPAHITELDTSDAYTLRRITGRDRGFTWGDK